MQQPLEGGTIYLLAAMPNARSRRDISERLGALLFDDAAPAITRAKVASPWGFGANAGLDLELPWKLQVAA